MKIIDIDQESHPHFVPRCPWCREALDHVYRVPDRKGAFHQKLGYLCACPKCGVKLDFELEFD